MIPQPSSSGAHSGIKFSDQGYRIVRKRNRVPINCYQCRSRKKCDRKRPCDNCVRREGADDNPCFYGTSGRRADDESANRTTVAEMQIQIDRLENLVLCLAQGGANVGMSTTTDRPTQSTDPNSGDSIAPGSVEVNDDVNSNLASSVGVLNLDSDGGKSMYVGQEHWDIILSDIEEVKAFFASHKKDLEKSYERVERSEPSNAREGPVLLLGCTTATDSELRSGLPAQSVVLALCSRYFDWVGGSVNIIHPQTFYLQLQAHRREPSKTPLMWLGLLYSVLCNAMLNYHDVGDEPPVYKGQTMIMAREFRLRTVQCLITADYTNPVEHTLETMLLYCFGEFFFRPNTHMGLWLVASMATRIAFRMGYHRDAKWFSSLTPFQAEMRRRTWALTRLADIMFSHLVSLPNTIKDHECDTEFPSNIYDEEFGPKSDVLPPSHPINEPTPISYVITKVRFYVKMSEIIQATNRVGGHVSYNDILDMDEQICRLYAAIPPHLQGAVVQGPFESVTTIIARFNINSLYQKIVCLLHKKYMLHAQHNIQYSHSRRRAVEAASQTLRHLVSLHRESQPGGALGSHPRFVHSISPKDFLLCAMIIALDLHHDQLEAADNSVGATTTQPFWTIEQKVEMIDTLETIKDIWKELASAEASKASKVLEIILNKLKSPSHAPIGDANANHNRNSNLRGDLEAAWTSNRPFKGSEFNTATANEISEPLDTFGHQNMSNVSMMPNTNISEIGNIGSEPAFSMLTDWDLGDESFENLNWVSLNKNLTHVLLKAI
ncbi:fungal-specific transcription factor domain-containing protein [Boeremia exigua]|uniref:fungal-specific transcription factor domain-containing protein n=1 Tax=Boeremia exigua TaxID=749465 RepID=UPI001E8E50C6|nr:fungal-specific transcription factor domain-containing protein [Boeremia exigua]KAH6625103.1 fungal-specific transcription factor domain-containing protein [Boeremia exigua]